MNASLLSLTPWLTAFGLLSLRTGTLFFLVPTLGGEAIPVRLRAALAALFSLVLLPLAGPVALTNPIALVAAATGEAVLGASLGLAVRILLSLAEMAGELAGISMGLSFMQIADPLTREVSDGAARLLGVFCLLVFVAIDGHHALLLGLGESLEVAPLGEVLPRATSAATLVPLLSSTISAATRIAAPVVVALLLTNGALALLARAAPQLNIFTLAFGITVMIGLIVLATSLAPSLAMLHAELRALPRHLSATLGALHVR